MRIYYSLIALLFLIATGCTKEVETLTSEAVATYYPVSVGKYITYRIDSTVFTNFGRSTETHSYQERHTVDAKLQDASGRDMYRVMRTIRDLNGTELWRPSGSYFVIPTATTIEVNENNLRYVKLVLPIKQDFSWKGNRYLPEDPYATIFGPTWSMDNDMASWDYTYTSVGGTATLNSKPYSDVITVSSIDESLNVPITSPQSYAYINKQVEQYAKGIGLIYQEFLLWDYQINNGGYLNGFGFKRSILDHN